MTMRFCRGRNTLKCDVVAIIFTAIVILFCAPRAYHFWVEADAPMTAERYARLCDNRSECYPEIGFGLAFVFFAYIALVSSLCLVVATGRAWLNFPFRNEPS
jgi:hypothetical protein